LRAVLAFVLLAAGASRRSDAQVAVHVAAGARYSGTLVHDSIVTAIDVRPDVAPVIGMSVTLPEHRGWAGGVVLDVGWSDLRRHEGGASGDLGGLTTFSFAVALRRSLWAGLGARVTAGGLAYMPERESGVFRGGAGELFPLLGAAVDWAPAAGHRWSVELRADAHRFLTRALRDAGFTEHRLVPRLSLAVRANVTGL
jgi:hypothetical protein